MRIPTADVRAAASLLLFLASTQCSSGEKASLDPGASAAAVDPAAPPGGASSEGVPSAETDPPPPPPPLAPGKKANIVFILTDDFSWNLVEHMPNLVKMQKAGVTFSRYFVTDSLCCPSRSSIFTGAYPHDTGVFTNSGDDGGYLTFKAKGNETATFATALQANGYATGMMGKYMNMYKTEMKVPPGWTDWAVADNGYPNFNYDLNENGKTVSYGAAPSDYLTDVMGRLGAAFVKKHAGGPFLLEIATFIPHAPFTPAPRDANLFPGAKAPRTPAFGARPGPDAPRWLAQIPALDPSDEVRIDTVYRKRLQSIQSVDRMIGMLQAAVAAAGKSEETYFVFSADNGFHLGEHSLRSGKQTAFDTDIRVPLIVMGPGVPAGRTIDAITENIDLCATFTELGQTAAPSKNDGRSLVPLLRGETVADWRDVALVEHHGPGGDPTDPDAPDPDSGNPTSYEALRMKDAVYVEYANGEREYHDHATDPYELDNTAAALPTALKDWLHATVLAVKNCHDAATCWAAQHLAP